MRSYNKGKTEGGSIEFITNDTVSINENKLHLLMCHPQS